MSVASASSFDRFSVTPTPSLATSPLPTTASPAELIAHNEPDPPPAPKPVKKRKAWGQPLPEPKTNLPPRKRAKTEDEKEQRRIERIKRNRAAAQTSRERKRLEFEAIKRGKELAERENQVLKEQLTDAQTKINWLLDQLKAFDPNLNTSTIPTTLPPSETLLTQHSSTSPTLTASLFKQDEPLQMDPSPLHRIKLEPPSEILGASNVEDLIPASDLAYFPAVKVCDLQCQSQGRMGKIQPLVTLWNLMLLQSFLMIQMSSVFLTLTIPLSQILHSWKTSSPIRNPTKEHLNLIFSLTTSTTLNQLLNGKATYPLTFRHKMLQSLLSCNPALARTMKYATLNRMLHLKKLFRSAQGDERSRLRSEYSVWCAIRRAVRASEKTPNVQPPNSTVDIGRIIRNFCMESRRMVGSKGSEKAPFSGVGSF